MEFFPGTTNSLERAVNTATTCAASLLINLDQKRSRGQQLMCAQGIERVIVNRLGKKEWDELRARVLEFFLNSPMASAMSRSAFQTSLGDCCDVILAIGPGPHPAEVMDDIAVVFALLHVPPEERPELWEFIVKVCSNLRGAVEISLTEMQEKGGV